MLSAAQPLRHTQGQESSIELKTLRLAKPAINREAEKRNNVTADHLHSLFPKPPWTCMNSISILLRYDAKGGCLFNSSSWVASDSICYHEPQRSDTMLIASVQLLSLWRPLL